MLQMIPLIMQHVWIDLLIFQAYDILKIWKKNLKFIFFFLKSIFFIKKFVSISQPKT